MSVVWTGEGWAKDTTPEHYRANEGDLQPWDVVDAFGLDFYRGNAVKYILRAGRKGPVLDDLRKASHYLQYLIDKEEQEEAATQEDVGAAGQPGCDCADGCECPECEPSCGSGVREAPEGPLREAQKIAREMADPEYVDEPKRVTEAPTTVTSEFPNPAEKLRWYLDRFHNGGR